MTPHHVFIAGGGGIGRALGLIMAARDIKNQFFIGDLYEATAKEAVDWINQGLGTEVARPVSMPENGSNDELDTVLEKCDIILDCLPGSQAPRLARLARKHELHYANLTEYVKETQEVLEIADGATTGFVLQTGLAPGFINVLAHKLYNDFTLKHKVEVVDRIAMKVGALTRNAIAPHFYGFTWSPIGVATEYIKEAEVVRDFEKNMVPSLSDTRRIIIDGITYEDNFTSGGAANLPDFFQGKVRDLDYRTIRWPGHWDWAKSIIEQASAKDRIAHLEKTMLDNIPAIEDDIVIIFSSVTGKDHQGRLHSIQKSYKIEPLTIGNRNLRAIQHTTAAALAELAHQLLNGMWQGPVLQSDIDPDSFLDGHFITQSYGHFKNQY